MNHSYLAFDLGAESGRGILGILSKKNVLNIETLHRFPTGNINLLGHLHWDIPGLYSEMLHTMRMCASEHTPSPSSIAIDTWGVDYGLFDQKGEMIANPTAYRDKRTDGMMNALFKKMKSDDMYARTGIQFMPINTIFQLYSMSTANNPQLKIAKDLLFIPDIFNYFFTGVMKSEFTFATTSQLYNPLIKNWDSAIFNKIGIDKSIMQDIVQPGTRIGYLTQDICDKTGLRRVPVVAVASHDTGSAVAAIPALDDDYAYISSGTWSLMGIKSSNPIINQASLKANFTNEGGVAGTFRFLKNIMGLWLVQQCQRAWERAGKSYSYAQLTSMAMKNTKPFASIINPDRPEFLSPANMVDEIARYCRKTDQPVPKSEGAFVRCILESLALDYRYTLEQIRKVSNKTINKIHIIGGGTQNTLLNQFTADAIGLPVHAGPVEATAIGNILVQAMAEKRIKSMDDLRRCVRNSFEISSYQPAKKAGLWDNQYEKFKKLKAGK